MQPVSVSGLLSHPLFPLPYLAIYPLQPYPLFLPSLHKYRRVCVTSPVDATNPIPLTTARTYYTRSSVTYSKASPCPYPPSSPPGQEGGQRNFSSDGEPPKRHVIINSEYCAMSQDHIPGCQATHQNKLCDVYRMHNNNIYEQQARQNGGDPT